MEFAPDDTRTLDIAIYEHDDGGWYAKGTEVSLAWVKHGRTARPTTKARDIVVPVVTNSISEVCADLVAHWLKLVYSEQEERDR